jgi:thioredoxin-like negative regulator of GroEL
VIHVESMARYRALIAKAPLCVIDFTAAWCGPCKQIAPHFAAMALANPTVHFLKVDVDECQDISAAENVRSMPTFKAYRYGAKVDEFSGADLGRLQGLVTRYLPTLS